VAGGGERVDAGAAHVHREGAGRLAAADDEVAPGLERSERVQVHATTVAELDVAHGDGGGPR
jgi:hypothetical protein